MYLDNLSKQKSFSLNVGVYSETCSYPLSFRIISRDVATWGRREAVIIHPNMQWTDLKLRIWKQASMMELSTPRSKAANMTPRWLPISILYLFWSISVASSTNPAEGPCTQASTSSWDVSRSSFACAASQNIAKLDALIDSPGTQISTNRMTHF